MRAHAVIRFLASHDRPAAVDDIRAGTGLGERGAGKAIRQLVTGAYIQMPEEGQYALTDRGRWAAGELVAVEEADAARAAEEAAQRQQAVPRAARRVVAVLAQELVIDNPARVMVGLDAPTGDQAPLSAAGHVVLRLSAPGCEVDPPECTLDVPADGAAGPVAFRVTPHQSGSVRLRLDARQVVDARDRWQVGGLFFDLNVADFPTPQSAEIQALGGTIELYAGVSTG
jgi:hypothetical protein